MTKRPPITIDGASGRIVPEGRARVVIVHKTPPEPSLGAVLDTVAREAIEDIARDAARELRGMVRRTIRGR
ncbi:MAG: hypothetical protein ACREPG_00170 [Candidatus Binatia bacterium]